MSNQNHFQSLFIWRLLINLRQYVILFEERLFGDQMFVFLTWWFTVNPTGTEACSCETILLFSRKCLSFLLLNISEFCLWSELRNYCLFHMNQNAISIQYNSSAPVLLKWRWNEYLTNEMTTTFPLQKKTHKDTRLSNKTWIYYRLTK